MTDRTVESMMVLPAPLLQPYVASYVGYKLAGPTPASEPAVS